jgi:hypothetical protein
VNKHEVEMIVATVRYLMQQRYSASDMVVLTPYLGQLLEIQRALAKDFRVLIDALDLKDLRKNGMVLPSASRSQARAGSDPDDEDDDGGSGGGEGSEDGVKEQGVRVATIDNYQGEEADIVLVSIVRSNDQGHIGFLKEPERVNVMLSRARCGMILVGDSETLCEARSAKGKDMWRSLMGRLEGHVYKGLPVICERHKQRPPKDLTTALHLQRFCPDGGCRLLCNVDMPCGHKCPLSCHAFDRAHASVQCEELVLRECPSGHLVEVECWVPQTSELACRTCNELQRIANEHAKERARRAKEEAKLKAQADIKRKTLEEQAETLRAEIEAVQKRAEAEVRRTAIAMEHMRLTKQLEVDTEMAPLQVCKTYPLSIARVECGK